MTSDRITRKLSGEFGIGLAAQAREPFDRLLG